MYWIIGRKSKLSLKNKLLIYKTIVKSIWTYGIPLWGTASNSNIEILQRFQNNVLRSNCEVREKTNKKQQLDVYYQHFLNMFWGIIMPIFRTTKTVCYCTWCTALVLLDVVGRGCGALYCRVRAVWRLLFDQINRQRSTVRTEHYITHRSTDTHS